MKRKRSSSEGEKKERHIVTWTPEEDDLLREQITTHGTDNWTIIASKFKDKTTRQCRRRWYTYLNSDFKKGGWTPEEDALLCEAQKVYGNKWTEIAKVVSGRTDNAVKNRFSTLCKKRTKHEINVNDENNNLTAEANTSKIISQIPANEDEQHNTTASLMIRRRHLPDLSGKYSLMKASINDNETAMTKKLRTPLAVLGQNTVKSGHDLAICHNHNICGKNAHCDDESENRKSGGTFLKKNDPKIFALLQQAELLSLLAQKVNSEKTEQSLEEAWKVFQDHLNRNKENKIQGCEISDKDLHLEDFKGMLEVLRSTNEISQPSSSRQPDLYGESPLSSEYSTGSTLVTNINMAAELAPCRGTKVGVKTMVMDAKEGYVGIESTTLLNQATSQTDKASHQNVPTKNDEVVTASRDFNSPPHVTPIFRSIAAEIPSPKFSESERNFLLKALGMESESRPSSNLNSSKISPACKRALLHSLLL